jgi:succinate dehydrogenase / fumarate reductase membrane anchor subunit
MSLATPIARVRGLGSAKEGVAHFKKIRVTSIASTFLTLWFVWSAVSLSGAGYAEVTAWLGSTLNATLMILFIVVNFWHAQLGVQTIIEDYVHQKLIKTVSLIALAFAAYGFAAASVVAVLKVALSG